jgi:predicted small secreted protein
MKKFHICVLLLTAPATLFSTSCATTKGFGQDLQKVGSRIENNANSTGGAEPAAATATAPASTPAPVVPSAY